MNLVRLHVTAEGQTEERFVKRVLCPHLGHFSVATDVRCVLTSRDRKSRQAYRGGFRGRAAYDTVRRDLASWLLEDRHEDARFTTMFDLYALPADFPGSPEAATEPDPYGKVQAVEAAMAADLGDRRFLPYVQLHEFETLILADPQHLDLEYLEHQEQIARLSALVRDRNPELINDGPETAPSKRILQEIPTYDKANAGPVVVERIGLEKLRSACRHFQCWLEKLERLAAD